MDEISKIDIPRIRFTTSHPRDFDDHLIEVLAKGETLLNISICLFNQDLAIVLKIMARKYTTRTIFGTC